MNLRKADFYYGSMLSCLINNGLVPALIESGESRRRYSLITNKGNYYIYSKYLSAPTKRNDTRIQLWPFTFSTDEVDYIRKYKENEKKLYFCLVCGREKLQKSEIAILSLDEVKNCMGIDVQRESYRITIKFEKGAHGLKAYGTGRADLLNGKDNTIRISRDMLSYL